MRTFFDELTARLGKAAVKYKNIIIIGILKLAKFVNLWQIN